MCENADSGHSSLTRHGPCTACRRTASASHEIPINDLEGWAEYAAGFCAEIGLYAEPAERYGRLSFERFMAARLVVDTGLNVLGWSRERAGAYLRVNGFLAATEIGSELLRYSIDDPGQALGYHLGHWYLRELRGTRDPLEFHEAVLAEGPLPLTILGEHVRAQSPGRRD